MRRWRIYPRGRENLPGGFDHARDLAVEGEFAELDAGDAELADEAARAAAHRAAVADARGRRVARELLQLLLRGEKFLVRGGRSGEDGLQLGALRLVFFAEVNAL